MKKHRDQNSLSPPVLATPHFASVYARCNDWLKTNCYRNYSRIQLLLRDHHMVWDSIHGQDFQAPAACTNVLLATAKRSLPDSELGYHDSQKTLGNFSLPFVVRMKPVEIANYYCPEKQTKQGDAGYLCASG